MQGSRQFHTVAAPRLEGRRAHTRAFVCSRDRCRLDLLGTGFLYCRMMNRITLVVRRVGLLAVAVALVGAIGCSTKNIQYKEDHDRIVRIDAAVESLRHAYVERDKSAFEAFLLPNGNLDVLQRDVQIDFDTFRDIVLEFSIERILIEGEVIDVFIHWQGQWKRDPSELGTRQRGHARLQWVGTQSILLRDVEGDLPFGMNNRAGGAEVVPSASR